MKTRQAIPIQEIGWIGTTSQFKQLPQGDPGGISTMWIDTAGTLPAGSQPTVLPRTRLSCLVPIDSCSTVPSNQQTLVQICFAIYDSTAEPSIYILHTRIECVTQQSES
ncbi:hypothetical protein BASA50_007631 [Batrachochytrium salamandrivorans]|uniref:Uncharacterized protein n=1 Tax=Batrachochytrium salamandrivorans TaxID=1357716 RepID=A0ABQ8F6J3_9FUNG|nr:hypothetical protein BASA60_005361 [Batrachochytrium salamandrivorans]KAH6587998.1 hypothetical protein BASA61_006147 [Batrachochytrium salamandrivorans]KAH6593111.1 hypothetical protein BASA50_007631 [Batrachochytrium salamandrivorans]KAH9266883.1 hypothetical protein BASA84_000953 [Batrachochytrium salamandrivorans]